jgi:hypothetical protein
LSGDFERNIKRALEVEHLSLHRGSVRGTWRRGFLSGDLERYVKRALAMEHLSSCGRSVRETWRGVLFLGTLKNMQRGLWKWNIFLYVGAL